MHAHHVILVVLCFIACIGCSGLENHTSTIIYGHIICKEPTHDYSIPVVLRAYEGGRVFKWKQYCNTNKEGEFFFNISKEVKDDCKDCVGELAIGSHRRLFFLNDTHLITLPLEIDSINYLDYVLAHILKYSSPMHPFFLLATIICLIVGLLYWNLRRTLGQAHTEPVITITREERINAANKQQEVLMKQAYVRSTTSIVDE